MADQQGNTGPAKKRGAGFWVLCVFGGLAGVVVLGQLVMTPEQRAAQQADREAAAQAAQPVRLTAPLDAAAQEARGAACMARMQHYRDLGVWLAGGARPVVAEPAWDLLEEAEQDEIFAAAACIDAAGQPGERMVTVIEDRFKTELETRRVANDGAFAAVN